MSADPNEISVLEWCMGLGASILTAVATALHLRHNRLEDSLDEVEARTRAAAAEGDKLLWETVTKHEDRSSAFREKMSREMFTKEDGHAMEQRILSSLRSTRRPSHGSE